MWRALCLHVDIEIECVSCLFAIAVLSNAACNKHNICIIREADTYSKDSSEREKQIERETDETHASRPPRPTPTPRLRCAIIRFANSFESEYEAAS